MSARSPRVVLVEDEEAVREAVERALEREGIAVTAFSDYPGADAVLAAAPDLAVLDVMLPNGDGFELARRLRAARDVPIVFLTARDTVEEKVLQLQESKRDLAAAIINADQSLIRNLKREDLELLLS